MQKILSSNALKCIAIFCMLLDHMWAMVIPGAQWLNYIGRIAFPIFAFQIVEGFFHTSDLKKYKKRLLIFALISEIPYNLMTMSFVINPFQQNVLWTFLIGIFLMEAIENLKKKEKIKKSIIIIILMILATLIGFTDYGVYGVETILVFYFFREKKLFQFVFLALIYIVQFKGLYISIGDFEFQTQGFGLLALPLIWLYDESKGVKNKIISKIGYWFYPVHILILYGISQII